jgi:hypothetical protein
MSEEATLANCSVKSIARFGDGEWRCAVGGGCTSQRPDPKLARELQTVLQAEDDGCMVGIPNPFHPDAPRRESWIKYTEPKFASLLAQDKRAYWSSFITRPDNAPWIDTPAYWEGVWALWRDQDVVLVVGDKKSITTEMIGDQAKSVREVTGPRQHAYAEIDRIEEEIGKTSARVLLCLGAAATVLAWRLSKKGIHALDLGHIGMFMRHAGAYRYSLDDLTSTDYRAQITTLHASTRWGTDGATHVEAVDAYSAELDAKTILDYGCGRNTLSDAMAKRSPPRRVSGYDPGIPDRAGMPKPCDLLVCSDVLEHVEPEKLDAVLDHIWRLTGKGAYFSISVKPARAVLPDGRNAHICLLSPDQWIEKLKNVGWTIARSEVKKNVNIWAVK